MNWRNWAWGLVTAGLLGMAWAGTASAQTSCSVETQAQLLNAFSDLAPPGSITPGVLRNFVCSTVAPSGASAFNPSFSGVFTNTQMNVPYSFITNGLVPQTEFQAQHPGHFATQGLVAGVAIPNTSTVYEADSGYFYENNASTTTGGVALGAAARNLAAGTVSWATNLLASDGGFNSGAVDGEWDLGCSNASSTCYGMSGVASFPSGTPAISAWLVFNTLDNPIAYDLWSIDGAAQNFALVGSKAQTANSDGQLVILNSRDGANTVRQCFIQAIHQSASGNLELTCSTGNVVLGVPVQLPGTTVAALPSCVSATRGLMEYVTDASSPTYNATLTGGSTTVALAVCNGTAWTAH